MLSRIEMYISYAIFELLSQQRCVSLLAILNILNRKLQEGGHSESEHLAILKEGANKQVISSQADSLIKISRIWADFFPANTSNQPI